MRLLEGRYKGFLNIYYSERNKKYYLQQNPESGSRYALFYPWLYWELNKYPIKGKLSYTGKILNKRTGQIKNKADI